MIIPFKFRKRLSSFLENTFSEKEKILLHRNTIFLCLRRLARQNYNPAYVIDVGAHNGNWTKQVYGIFPHASYIVVEALPDKKLILENIFTGIQVKVYNNLLGDRIKKNVPFYSMETGSSVLQELSLFPREIIYLDMITLDEIAKEQNIKGNILLKLDVQGFELEVLKGAASILQLIDIICMEISFLNYNDNAPLAHEVIKKMHEWGFYIFDITGMNRKENDFALIQADFIFIKSDSPIRNRLNNMKTNFKVIESTV